MTKKPKTYANVTKNHPFFWQTYQFTKLKKCDILISNEIQGRFEPAQRRKDRAKNGKFKFKGRL